LFLIRIPLESPDMLVAACVYVLAGLLLRLRRGRHGWRVFLALGVVCGIGYWIKAPLFVFSLLIIPLALVFAGWRSWPRALGALVVFLVLCSPWIMAISQRVGRLTFGESGRLNYMWVINEVPQIHGQDGGDVRGAFLHPTRRIYAQPAAYEFATPVGGTYPVWYDPSYWFAGVSGHFSLRGHLAALSGNIARLYWFIFFDVLCGLLAGTLILWLLRQPRAWPKDLWPYAPLFVPACLGVALFMQLYLEGRYIAPFLVLFWLGGWAALRLPVGELTQRLARSATVVLAGLLLCSILISSAGESVATLRALWQGEVPAEHEEWQVAQYLHQRGVQPGDRVAVFGGSQRSFWARLSRTRIVAEIPEREITAFLEADHATQEAALAALGATGAKVVLTLSVSADRRLPGWQQVGQTPYFAYWFKPTPR
jgi:4-amino-4-deoxy-L-arabinose transferase-like glycosyltransferase